MPNNVKPGGLDWTGAVPAGWGVKRLKYAGTARNGLTYTPKDTSDDGVLVLRSSNIQDGKLAFEDNVYVNMKIPKELIVRENDILICSRNGSRELIGKCALIDNKTAGNTYGAFMCVFRSQYNRFIYYVFQSNIFDYYLGSYSTSTINQLTNTDLYNMKIPLPPPGEQQAIAAFLDERCGAADAVIAGMEEQAETLKQYKASLIAETVTKGLHKAAAMRESGLDWIGEIPAHWGVSKIKYVFRIVCGSTPDSNKTDFWDGDIPWITPADMNDFGVISRGERNITKKGYNSCATSLLPKESIVISTRAPVGKINITASELCTNQGCKSLVNQNVNTKYFYYLLNAGQEELIRQGRGTTFIELGAFELGNLPVPLPPPGEQQAIAAFLDERCGKVDAVIAAKRQAVETMRAYKPSLIYEYVTGKRRVNGVCVN
jgi:type I restriction enzyme S subunit